MPDEALNVMTLPEQTVLTRKSVLAERLDLAVIWVACEIFGAVAISVVPERHPFIRMVGPLLIMVGYLTFSLSRSRFSTVKVADSVYFMGFLWTLWALIDLLIIGGKQLSATSLYSAFGYALTATAAGMFWRLSILQFFRTVEDQEDEAVDSIDERVRMLVAEIESSTRAIAALRGEAAGELVRWHKEFAGEAQRHLATVAKLAVDFEAEGEGLTNAVKVIRSSVSATNRTFADLERRIASLAIKVAQELSGSIGEFERSIRSLSSRVGEIDVPRDVLTRAVDNAVQDTRTGADALRNLAMTTLAELKGATEELAMSLRNLPKSAELDKAIVASIAQITAVCSSYGQMTDEVEKSTVALGALQLALDKIQQTTNNTGSDVEERMRNLKVGLAEANASMQAVKNGAHKTGETLRDIVTFLDRQFAGQ